MSLEVHHVYPGVALVITGDRAVLLGAPADAFKATKSFCNQTQKPFPRVLVAPERMLVGATPQFNPEFFLYDFLFVYGAAFKPELAQERLMLVADETQIKSTLRALEMTLTGPSRAELASYRDAGGHPLLTSTTVNDLATVSEQMAIKKEGRARRVDEMVDPRAFDREGSISLWDGALKIWRQGPCGFRVRAGDYQADIDVSVDPPVAPFAKLGPPKQPHLPETFGIMPLGTRSGFDLTGPTTGFLLWVNGRALMYDGPPGARYLLEHQGISGDDIEGVVLSHCHEDHMAAFVELILAGQRPKVYTSEPIYRSALVKLSNYFGKSEAEVAGFLDYRRVTPGEPVPLLGATLDFFYTVHAIPTLGLSVSMRQKGETRRIQISGDTMHHEGLGKMQQDGVISADVFSRMKNLVPLTKIDNALFFNDVGEAIIHGHPKDWQDNPNRVLYYHCADSEHTRSFGRELAVGGTDYIQFAAARFHPATSARLLKALSFLGIEDPHWLASLLHVGSTRTVEAGTRLAEAGEPDQGRRFSVIVSGAANVFAPDSEEPLFLLRPGEFFGTIELVDETGKYTASIVAETPMELFDIDAQVFHDYLRVAGVDDVLRDAFRERGTVDSVRLFRQLDVSLKNTLAQQAKSERRKPQSVILEQGKAIDAFYLVMEGKVALTRNGALIAEVSAKDEDNFFGEICSLDAGRPQPLAARALTAVRLLRVEGEALRQLVKKNMGIRFALSVALRRR